MKSKAAKSAAIGFIVITLLGNYWLVHALTGKDAPSWLYDAFYICAFWILISGVCMAFGAIKNRL